MVKHLICRQQPTNGLSVFDHFVWLVLKGLSINSSDWYLPLQEINQVVQLSFRAA